MGPVRLLRVRSGGLAMLVAGMVLLAGCSPEATRTRGGGPGADVGNWGSPIDMHGRQDVYQRTPNVGTAARK